MGDGQDAVPSRPLPPGEDADTPPPGFRERENVIDLEIRPHGPKHGPRHGSPPLRECYPAALSECLHQSSPLSM